MGSNTFPCPCIDSRWLSWGWPGVGPLAVLELAFGCTVTGGASMNIFW